MARRPDLAAAGRGQPIVLVTGGIDTSADDHRHPDTCCRVTRPASEDSMTPRNPPVGQPTALTIAVDRKPGDDGDRTQ